jgi:serpin B
VKRIIVILILAVLILCGCAHNKQINTTTKTNQVLKPQETLVKNNNAFAFHMYKELSKEKTNVLFSPYSISTAFGMVYGGAAGTTEKEIASVLHFTMNKNELHPTFKELEITINKAQETKDIQLHIANGLFAAANLKDKFRKDYFKLVQEDYHADLDFLDFTDNVKSANTINTWVEKKTNSTIQDLINPDLLDPSVALVLVDAIYFKGDWLQKFKPENTVETDFFVADNKENSNSKVNMMNLQTDFNYTESDNLQLIELPYHGEQVSMLVLLPKNINGIKELEATINLEQFEYWKNAMQPTTVNVFLPKFKMTLTYDKMVNTLKKMGMTAPFGGSADFSSMITNQRLYISDVIHKAFIVVNEEGTEASAATGMVMRKTSINPNQKLITFRADHPFIYLIQDNVTGSILFMGKMQDPSSK